MTVRQLFTSMSSREMSEWMAFEAVAGPVGQLRGDFNAGTIAAVIANANRDSKKQPTPFFATDFVPDWSGGESSGVDS